MCTVSGNTVSYVGVGTCTLTASATATTDYTAVTGSAQSFTVGRATPTISISDLPASGTYGGSFTATYSYSGNGSPTESVSSSTTGVCTVSGNTVSYVGVGTCTLTASATATTDYTAVTGSAQSFTVSQATPTISISDLPASGTYGGSFTATYSYSGQRLADRIGVVEHDRRVHGVGQYGELRGGWHLHPDGQRHGHDRLRGGDGQRAELHGEPGHADDQHQRSSGEWDVRRQLHGDVQLPGTARRPNRCRRARPACARCRAIG